MSGPRTNAAFYAAPVTEFLTASDEEAYAPLAAPKGYTLAPEQLSAWALQLPVLRVAHDHRGGPVALRPPHGARHHPQRRGGREPRGHERCGGADHRRSPRAAAEGVRVCDGRARCR